MTAASDKAYTDLWRTYASHPLGAPESPTLTEILKFYFEPEEAALAAKMSFQAETDEVIAKRAGLSLEEASQKIIGLQELNRMVDLLTSLLKFHAGTIRHLKSFDFLDKLARAVKTYGG